MKAIDKIRQANRERRRKMHVDAWDLDLYFGPLTTADQIAVDERMDDDGKDSAKHQHERRIYLLIHKAELEDGSRAFSFGDKHTLMNEADFVTLQEVIGFMYRTAAGGLTDDAVDDAKKD